MQSVQSQVIDSLKRKVDQKYQQGLLYWNESDKTRAQYVLEIAEALEEFYVQQGQHQLVKSICVEIKQNFEKAGAKNTHHIPDFLPEKYKRDYDNSSFQEQKSASGLILHKNVPDIVQEIDRIDTIPEPERSPDDIRNYEDCHRKLEDYYNKKAVRRKSNQQIAQIKKVALDDQKQNRIGRKEFPYVGTDNPHNNYTGLFYNEYGELVKDVEALYLDVKRIQTTINDWFDAGKLDEKLYVDVTKKFRLFIQDLRAVIAPEKDLKYATSMHNWWATLIKFLEHGKHAGGVMTSIPSHKIFKTLRDGTKIPIDRPLTREQVGDRIEYVEDLLENFAEDKGFFGIVKAFFRGNRMYDRDDIVRKWRGEFVKKLVRYIEQDTEKLEDFLRYLSHFREKTQDSPVATRRIEAHEKLSEYA